MPSLGRTLIVIMANNSESRMHWPAIVSGVFCLLVVVAVALANFIEIPSDPGNAPIYMIDIRVPKQSRAIFFRAMSSFADKNQFKAHVGPTDPSDNGYNVYLDRSDVFVWAVNPWQPFTFHIGVYGHAGVLVSEQEVKRLVEELKTAVYAIPGAERAGPNE